METPINILAFITCFGLAIWFTSLQFDRYGKNNDLSVVSYRRIKFDSESKDQPPTYTLCTSVSMSSTSHSHFDIVEDLLQQFYLRVDGVNEYPITNASDKLVKIHQNSHENCYSRYFRFPEDNNLARDFILFNASTLMEFSHYAFEIYMNFFIDEVSQTRDRPPTPDIPSVVHRDPIERDLLLKFITFAQATQADRGW